MNRCCKTLVRMGKIKPFLFGMAVMLCLCVLLTGVNSKAGVSDNAGSGFVRLAHLFGVGKEASVPKSKSGFNSATIMEKINYLEDENQKLTAKLSAVEKKLGEAPKQTVVLQGSGVNTSTKEAREALVNMGFTQVSTMTSLSGKTIYGFIKTSPVGNFCWEEADKVAREYYKEVNDWSSSKGYGLIAFKSNLPTAGQYSWIYTYCPKYDKESYYWLSTKSCQEYSRHLCLYRKYADDTNARNDSTSGGCVPIVWTY